MTMLWKKIELAQRRIAKAIHRTPAVYSDTLSKCTGVGAFSNSETSKEWARSKSEGLSRTGRVFRFEVLLRVAPM